MQRSLDPSLSWPHVVYVALAGILGYFVREGKNWILLWMNRKRPAADLELSEAQARKTRAEARKINAEADVEFSAIVERLHARIDQMQVRVDGIRAERDEWKDKAESLESQREVDEHYIKRLTAANELGITLKELDQIKPPQD